MMDAPLSSAAITPNPIPMLWFSVMGTTNASASFSWSSSTTALPCR
eukprot:CAMPEP_0182544736 /NCGR_PEP_ID=MMETSP1323-20130603/33562_1 /TAXON_ID=236787 /ORGANISM="Florenciella parvula, Strain RCC1693" /LENGTH=45 /DNA_ID= /DNA_START= /DNA_END= /DNA_ORIENTATION=